mmetsp:Transcript_25462/g.43990  ORF Transcript_25462/g.43990 Transcript_25462/m.43990 type:complete len:133 (+) Transcript_25462:76-474(+)
MPSSLHPTQRFPVSPVASSLISPSPTPSLISPRPLSHLVASYSHRHLTATCLSSRRALSSFHHLPPLQFRTSSVLTTGLPLFSLSSFHQDAALLLNGRPLCFGAQVEQQSKNRARRQRPPASEYGMPSGAAS